MMSTDKPGLLPPKHEAYINRIFVTATVAVGGGGLVILAGQMFGGAGHAPDWVPLAFFFGPALVMIGWITFLLLTFIAVGLLIARRKIPLGGKIAPAIVLIALAAWAFLWK